jgi:Uma2 family endonuclease
MATVSHKLTLDEFAARYAGEKPYYEFWFGEAVQKSASTWIHASLQRILMNLLSDAGYKAGSELELRIDPEFHPIPDVVATKRPIEIPYPTKAVEVVVEILSDDDSRSRLIKKCQYYQDWGFEQIYVVDPNLRVVFRWANNTLEETATVVGLPAARIWAALEAAIQ